MSDIIEISVPLLIALLMTVVGLEVTWADVRRVLHFPWQIGASLLGQAVLLPLWAALLVRLLDVQPVVAGAIMLIACAPQATMSNVFCMLARSDVALSVTMTAVSNLLALVITPASTWLGFHWLFDQHSGLSLPAGQVLRHLATGMFLPLIAGMLMRHFAADLVARHRARLQAVSMAALAVLLGLILWSGGREAVPLIAPLAQVGTAFTLGAAALGFALARAVGWPARDVVTLVAAFPARSLSVATLITVNVLGQTSFLALAALFFLLQALLMTPLMLLLRRYAAVPKDPPPAPAA